MHQVKDKNADLHGNVPESSPVALLLIDVINDMDFDGAEALVTQAEAMAPRIARLKQRARRGPHSRCLHQRQLRPLAVGLQKADRALPQRQRPGRKGREAAAPGRRRLFRAQTETLCLLRDDADTLLAYLGATTLIMTGVAGNICILFSANDAYMRDYNIIVPSDCVVSNTRRENDNALDQIERVLKGT